jgi:hypothetical protein
MSEVRSERAAQLPDDIDPEALLGERTPELARLLSSDVRAFDLEAARKRVHAAVGREHGFIPWLRSRTTPIRLSFVFGWVLVIALFEFFFFRRDTLSALPTSVHVAAIVLPSIVLIAGGLFELWPLQRRPLPRWLVSSVLSLALLLPFALSFWRGPSGASAWESVGSLSDAGKCFLRGALLATPLIAILWASDRSAHNRRYTALLAGLLAGLAGNVALFLHCRIDHPLHLVAGHASIGVALALGYLAVRRLASSRAS